MVITDQTILPPHLERQRQMMKELAKKPKSEVEPETDKKPGKRKLSGKMRERWMLFNRLVDVEQKNLTDSEFRVLITLFRDMKRGIAKTSQSDLARRCGKCRGSVGRAVKKLAERGLIEIVRQGGLIGPEGQHAMNEYRVK